MILAAVEAKQWNTIWEKIDRRWMNYKKQREYPTKVEYIFYLTLRLQDNENV